MYVEPSLAWLENIMYANGATVRSGTNSDTVPGTSIGKDARITASSRFTPRGQERSDHVPGIGTDARITATTCGDRTHGCCCCCCCHGVRACVCVLVCVFFLSGNADGFKEEFWFAIHIILPNFSEILKTSANFYWAIDTLLGNRHFIDIRHFTRHCTYWAFFLLLAREVPRYNG